MNSLLLIPDISGFTKFVNETDSEHSRHIISELLELLIDSNSLGMTVSEIEGDAVMFYLKDRVPGLEDIMATVRQMFLHFHRHLKSYEARRICRCGACSTAEELTLKIVAHAGPLNFVRVKEFMKPYGKSMILIHRLLKNDISGDEYILMSDALATSSDQTGPDDKDFWESFEHGSTTYEDLGDVSYRYASLTPLRLQIPSPPAIVDFERTEKPVAESICIGRSVTDTYALVSDLDLRLSWNDGPTRLEYQRDRVNRVGTRHQCVIRGDLIEFETITADYGPQKLVYGERFDGPPLVREMAFFYVFSAADGGTSLTIELHYRTGPFPGNLLGPTVRFIARRRLKKILSRIREVAEACPETGAQA